MQAVILPDIETIERSILREKTQTRQLRSILMQNRSYNKVSYHTYIVCIKSLENYSLSVNKKQMGSWNLQILEHFANTTSIATNTFIKNLIIPVKREA